MKRKKRYVNIAEVVRLSAANEKNFRLLEEMTDQALKDIRTGKPTQQRMEEIDRLIAALKAPELLTYLLDRDLPANQEFVGALPFTGTC
jgi:uncharacterized protein YjiS (DUF1127 family)